MRRYLRCSTPKPPLNPSVPRNCSTARFLHARMSVRATACELGLALIMLDDDRTADVFERLQVLVAQGYIDQRPFGLTPLVWVHVAS